ncbi:IclR family transcriptional regulator [Nocardioides sp. LMS-CY]|uniref:IclR family transcriptional regulator n=1 Tax=Nocardioides sp. (strain LMS-CY) TaxID=2840457 RepID=UPI001BFFE06C|nr:IclR family transcriptional regulator [Nocardioides sp. LMS-CY]QWF23237.1 IclR family transcriptional regulator [Nocardioides sp. LMS-CY]
MSPQKNEATPSAETTRATPTIQTVQRAAVVLGSFTVTKPFLSLNEITSSLGTSKATAHRYTKALRAADLLRYDERTSLFSLGPQVLTLAAAARAGLPIVAAAEPYMEALLKRVDETVVLSVWDGESAIVVRSLDNTARSIRISVSVGARLDPLHSAQGRVFSSFLSPEQVPGLARALRREPELIAELETIRERGGLSLNSPDVNGLRTIAAPIFEGSAITATMAIVGTATSVPDELTHPMAQALVETTRELSSGLGDSSAFQQETSAR